MDGDAYTVFGTDFDVGRLSTKRRGAQLGVDYLMGTNAVIGVTGGYERAKADVRNSVSDFTAKGWNIGAYAMFGGSAGFYVDVLVKYDRANLDFANALFVDAVGDPDIKSWGAQGQIGYRFVSGDVNFDLGAGLAHVKSKIDDFAVGTIGFVRHRLGDAIVRDPQVWNQGEWFERGRMLESDGLIAGHEGFASRMIVLDGKGNGFFLGQRLGLVAQGTPNSSRPVSVWTLTRLGQQVASLLPPTDELAAATRLAALLPKDGLERLSAGPWVAEEGGRYTVSPSDELWTRSGGAAG